MWNGFKREESSRKLYAMNNFISMMIHDMDLDLEQKIHLVLCWHRTNKDKPIQTSDRWVFTLFGRTEERFLNVLKMKSFLINSYIRYEKRIFPRRGGNSGNTERLHFI